MWWNGWVFSFEKDPKSTNIGDGESSGMDEAINCLDNDFDMQVLDQQEFELQEDLIDSTALLCQWLRLNIDLENLHRAAPESKSLRV